MNERLRTEMLPDPGPNKWWEVELAKPHLRMVRPIKVSLMESFDVTGLDGPKRPGRVLMHMLTVAQPDKIRETGDKILAAVGDYAKYVGEYYILPRETRGEEK